MKYATRVVLLIIGIIFVLPGTHMPASAHHISTSEHTRQLVEMISPAVVTIRAYSEIPFDDFYEEKKPDAEKDESGKPKKPKKGFGSGSGFVINDARGLVVTNNHVVNNPNLARITIELANGAKTSADIVGTDPYSDIALLKMSRKGLPPEKRAPHSVLWGSSKKLGQGESVIAIGSPFGLSRTVTKGIVSTLDRYPQGSRVPTIQHDAAVNRGNSGGPLFNMRGEVVGINTAIFSPTGGSVGIAFAVPSDIARRVVADLEKYGRVRRGYLGTEVSNVIPAVAKSLGLPNTDGVFIAKVQEGKPADLAGLQRGDVMLSWGGKPTKTLREMLRLVAQSEIDKAVPVEIWRGGKTITVMVTPMERPREIDEQKSPPPKLEPEEDEKDDEKDKKEK